MDVRARRSTRTSATSPSRGRRPRSRGATTTARAATASSATARRTGSSRASPAPTRTRTSRSRRRSRPACTASRTGSTPPPRFDGNAYVAPDVERVPWNIVEAIDAFRDELDRGRRVRRRRARAPAEHGRAGMGDVQPRGHRLGTAPELRPMVSTDPVLIGITGRPIAAGKIGSAAAVGVGVRLPRRARTRRRDARRHLAPRARRRRGARVARPRRRAAVPRRPRCRARALRRRRSPDRSTAPTSPTTSSKSRSRTPRSPTRRADARDLPRHPGPQRRARRHADPAPSRTARASALHGRPGEPGGARDERGRRSIAGSLLAKTMDAERVTCSCHHHQSLDRLGDRAAGHGARRRRRRRSRRGRPARGCSRCSGTPRTPPAATPRSSACSTPSSPRPAPAADGDAREPVGQSVSSRRPQPGRPGGCGRGRGPRRG